jgi:hypothetical protein
MAVGGKGDGGDGKACDLSRLLVGKTDRHAQLIDGLQRDVEAIGTDLKQTIAAVKVILDRPTPTDAGGGEAPPPAKGQPEWLECRDGELAEALLCGTDQWMTLYGDPFGPPLAPCWPWHPAAVVLLLAAAEQHQAAYAGKAAVAVTEFWTRFWPTIAAQVRKITDGAQCTGHGHREPGDRMEYAVHPDQLPDLAAWWATDRTGLPPGLTRRLEAVF